MYLCVCMCACVWVCVFVWGHVCMWLGECYLLQKCTRLCSTHLKLAGHQDGQSLSHSGISHQSDAQSQPLSPMVKHLPHFASKACPGRHCTSSWAETPSTAMHTQSRQKATKFALMLETVEVDEEVAVYKCRLPRCSEPINAAVPCEPAVFVFNLFSSSFSFYPHVCP